MYVLPDVVMEHVPADKRSGKLVREFGKANGFKVGDRGRIPREVYEAYAAQFVSTFVPEVCPDAVPF